MTFNQKEMLMYFLAEKTQHLKMIKHNKNYLNWPLELDDLEPEDESIETFLNIPDHKLFY